MDEKKFTVFLGVVIVPYVVQLIAENKGIAFFDAAKKFYNSKVYSFLECEETKFWHYSHHLLCQLYLQEEETGDFEFPEEAA